MAINDEEDEDGKPTVHYGIDRGWLRYGIRAEDRDNVDGVTEEEFLRTLKESGLNESNKHLCATVNVNFQASRPGEYVVAYDVSFEFAAYADVNHDTTRYWYFLRPPTMETLRNLNPSYITDETSHVVWGLVSELERLKTRDGKYTNRPDPVLLTVAAAIGAEYLPKYRVEK